MKRAGAQIFIVLIQLINIINVKAIDGSSNATNEIFDDFYFIILFLCIITIIVLLLLYLRYKRKSKCTENINELHNTFLNSYKNAMYMKDDKLKYIYANKAFEKIFKKNQNEIIHYDIYNITDKKTADDINNKDHIVLDKMTVIEFEFKLNDKVYKSTKYPLKLLNGKYGIGGFVEDITEAYYSKRKLEKTLLSNQIIMVASSRNFKSTKEQFEYVLNQCLKLTESKIGYIFFYDEDKNEFELIAWSKGVMEECRIADKNMVNSLHKNSDLIMEAIRRREPFILNDYNNPNPIKKGYPKGHISLKKFVSIPIIFDDKIVAVVGLANKEEDYDVNDIYRITTLMNSVWNAKERREALINLTIERNKLLQTLISIGDGVLVTDMDGYITMFNPTAEKLTGLTSNEVIGKSYKDVFKLSYEFDIKSEEDPIERVISSGEKQKYVDMGIIDHKEGKKFYVELSSAPIKDDSEKTVGVVLVFRDVSDKVEQLKKIEFLSFHDSLTGLYNRRFFEEELIRMDTDCNLPLSVIMGDANGLKLINDIFGHSYGDKLLQKTAEVLKRICRNSDVIARWGGDEFVLLLPKTSLNDAEKIISRIKTEFAKEKIRAIKGSISMGADTKYHPKDNIRDVLKRAEERMYFNKTLERNMIQSSIINTLMNTLHENSERELEHSERVRELSVKIGKELNLSEVELKHLQEAAYLHDIGKIVLDQTILNKNYKLNPDDWNQVKKHVIVGYRILSLFDNTIDVAKTVLAHHENYDGTGYPKGLKGEEIPLSARIIALAENYDRMTHDSVTNKAVSKEEAIKIIKEKAGKEYDSDLVKILEKVI